MYQGDAEEQQRIRESRPDGDHCVWLKTEPRACSCLPVIDGAEDRAGQVCPNNPFENGEDSEKLQADYLRFLDFSDITTEALKLYDEWKLGLVDVCELRPEEQVILSVTRQEIENRQRRVESDYLAHKIVETLAKAWGGSS